MSKKSDKWVTSTSLYLHKQIPKYKIEGRQIDIVNITLK